MDIKERQEYINQIVYDCGTCYDYKDFAADCVREVVTKWNDDEILSRFGVSPDDEENED